MKLKFESDVEGIEFSRYRVEVFLSKIPVQWLALSNFLIVSKSDKEKFVLIFWDEQKQSTRGVL